MADANLSKRFGVICERIDKIFRFSCGELFVEVNDQQISNAEVTDERDFVFRRGQKMRSALGPQYFFRMRIKSDNHRCSIRRARVFGRSGNDGLMSAMNPVENADREKQRTP